VFGLLIAYTHTTQEGFCVRVSESCKIKTPRLIVVGGLSKAKRPGVGVGG